MQLTSHISADEHPLDSSAGKPQATLPGVVSTGRVLPLGRCLRVQETIGFEERRQVIHTCTLDFSVLVIWNVGQFIQGSSCQGLCRDLSPSFEHLSRAPLEPGVSNETLTALATLSDMWQRSAGRSLSDLQDLCTEHSQGSGCRSPESYISSIRLVGLSWNVWYDLS